MTTTSGWDNPAGRNLSIAEKDRIRKLKKAGYGRNAIAVKLGRGYATISRYLRSNGDNAPVKTVYWTREEDRRLIHLQNEGKSQVQIAEALGRSRGAVGVRLSEHRKAALEGTEIHYRRTNAAESPKRAPEAVGAAFAEVPELISVSQLGPIDLTPDLDLWAIWQRLVFGGASQL